MLKAVVSDISALPDGIASYYTKQTKGALKNKWLLQVETVDGVELLDVELLRAEEKKLSNALEKRLVADEIERAVSAAGGNLTLLAPHLAERAKLDSTTLSVVVTNAKGQPDYNLKGKPSTIADLVADFSKDPAFARAFDKRPAEHPASAATQPRTTPIEWGSARTLTEHTINVRAQRSAAAPQKFDIKSNPWKRETVNITHQMMITRSDPTRAAQLRAEAER